MAGYSGTPLAKKLGIKANFKIKVVNAPSNYFDLFSDLPPVEMSEDDKEKKDFIHYFETSAEKLNEVIPQLKQELKPNGMLWVSWYKKSAKQSTDITEDVIRSIALRNDLVDIKVCAVDDEWSGLKLVIPVEKR